MFVPYQALNRLPSDPEADDIPICHSASLTKHYLGLDQTNANAYLRERSQFRAQFCHFILDGRFHSGLSKSKIFQMFEQKSTLLPPVLSTCLKDSRWSAHIFMSHSFPTWSDFIDWWKWWSIGDIISFEKLFEK